jgi:hypothetical protein
MCESAMLLADNYLFLTHQCSDEQIISHPIVISTSASNSILPTASSLHLSQICLFDHKAHHPGARFIRFPPHTSTVQAQRLLDTEPRGWLLKRMSFHKAIAPSPDCCILGLIPWVRVPLRDLFFSYCRSSFPWCISFQLFSFLCFSLRSYALSKPGQC